MKNLDVALDAREKGIVAIPVHLGTKVPALKTWKEWQTEMPPVELLREWFRRECNVAIITTGMVVFDCDDPAKADLVRENCGETPHVVRTPRGGLHLGFRKRKGCVLTNQVKVKGEPLDIRTDGGLELLPNSETPDGRYEWQGSGLRPISELPVANIGWTRTRKKKVQSSIAPESCEDNDILFRGKLYIDKFHQRAVSGQRGHTTFFTMCLKICTLVKTLGGGPAEAWQLIRYCNETKCDPPWREEEPNELKALEHKLRDAWQKSR